MSDNYSNIVRPTRNLDGTHTLDMRVSNKTGYELALQISESVAHTQKFVITDIPSTLIVTQKQFASLQNYTEEMYDTTDRMFRTGDGYVMEVTIDRDIDTVREVEDAIQMIEDINQLEAEQKAKEDNE